MMRERDDLFSQKNQCEESPVESSDERTGRCPRRNYADGGNGLPSRRTFLTLDLLQTFCWLWTFLMIGTPTVHASQGEENLAIFVNRHGGDYVRGYSDSATNRSSVLGESLRTTTVRGFQGDEEQWQQFFTCLKDQFGPYRIDWLLDEPVSGSYMELVVGDVPEALGLHEKTVGIAPMDKEGRRILPRAVAFVFSERIGAHRPQRVCEVAAQEIGHALGLDHSLLCEDPMSYLKGCGNKSFQNRSVECGEQTPRACKSGELTQNTVELLDQRLGRRMEHEWRKNGSAAAALADLQEATNLDSASSVMMEPVPPNESHAKTHPGQPRL